MAYEYSDEQTAADYAAGAAYEVAEANRVDKLAESVSWGASQAMGEASQEESLHQTVILRDIFGHPNRGVNLDLNWFTPAVTSLAEAIYADHAFDRLPILADALEDAGCTNRDILDHCRQPGEHVRGCWVVDLVLGKS